MSQRIDYFNTAPDGIQAVFQLERYVRGCGLDRSLVHLVKTRASQLNGCAFCVDMHTKEARADGEEEQRLHLLAVWREAPCFTARERAALAWTEAVTLLGPHGPSDDRFVEVREHFSEKEVVDLTLAIAGINTWNRLAVTFRSQVGSYEPAGAMGKHA